MQKKNYRLCFREPDGLLTHPFIVPGSGYTNSLWDWDSWLTDLALRRIAAPGEMERYEKGCILNFLGHMDAAGRIPICILPKMTAFEEYPGQKNIHKPCLAQHALFIAEQSGDAEWLREQYGKLETFVGWYARNCRHESGLYFWLDDFAIGVDNDPCTFYRPDGSSASIYLNCLMYRELLAMAELGARLGLEGKADCYRAEAEALKGAIQTCCWDERDGMFYNVDINLLPVDRTKKLHSGCPRHWSTLIQRIDVWPCFLPMWAGLATPEQAERMVARYRDERTFFAPYGVRTLSKMEKMYAVLKSGNPSCWLGPIWGISNYMVFDGLVRYGYTEDAKDLAEKTVRLFGKDIEACGELHEYYDPETGLGVNNPGFQNWNLLSVNMFEWLRENNG